jgi:hypothetical protein
MVETMSDHPTIRPYDVGDRLTEAELAARSGKTPRALRAQRANRTAAPYTRDGKTIIYSWSKYLQHLERNERGPIRARRRTDRAASQSA